MCHLRFASDELLRFLASVLSFIRWLLRKKDTSQPATPKILRSNDMTYVKAFWLLLLNLLKVPADSPDAGPLVGCKIALTKEAVAEDSNLVWDDLTESTFPGYARSASITWGTPALSHVTGEYVMGADAKTFSCTGDPGEEKVMGYALVTGATPPVLLAYKSLAPEGEPLEDGGVIVVMERNGFNVVANIPPGDIPLT